MRFRSQNLIEFDGDHRALVCWFTSDWINSLIGLVPELSPVTPLLAQAPTRIAFRRKNDGAPARPDPATGSDGRRRSGDCIPIHPCDLGGIN